MSTVRADDAFPFEMVEAAVAEAERGWDVEDILAKRSPGRPLEVGSTPAIVIQVRMDLERLTAIDERADERGITRSAFIRQAVDELLAA